MRATNRPWRQPGELAPAARRAVSRHLDPPAGIRITARTATAGATWSHAIVAGASIHVALIGSAAEQTPAGSVLLSRATLAVRPAREPSYEFRAGPSGVTIVTIDYTPKALQRLTPCDRVFVKMATFKGRSSVELAWRILGELHAPDALTRATLRIFADGIAIGCCRGLLRSENAEAPPVAAAALRILQKEFRKPPTLGRLAKRVGCTPAHLARTFRKSYGFTVRGWVEARRVEEGKRRLSSSRDSIGSIAEQLGFADQAHFARAFRRATSVTPRQFRGAAAEINPVLK